MNRLQHIESRVDVLDAALAEAREHSAVREQQERKIREGMERKYSVKATSKVCKALSFPRSRLPSCPCPARSLSFF